MFSCLKKRSRINHWSCSKFADWIRGTQKPFALEWKEWDRWHDDAKNKHPFRYWVADELLDCLQDFINLPLDIYHTFEVYIRNRFIDKIHYLKTGLKAGEYYDFNDRVLHGLFNELKDIVEIEYANIARIFRKEGINYFFKNGRCPLAGLDYLNWSSRCVYDDSWGIFPDDELYNQPTEQSKSANKILELYNWWKNIRPNRANPYELFSEVKDGQYYFQKISKMEDSYYEEDTKMLISLIKIRDSIWT